jgi:hypothetical protein
LHCVVKRILGLHVAFVCTALLQYIHINALHIEMQAALHLLRLA